MPSAADALVADAEPEIVEACDSVLAAMTTDADHSSRNWHPDALVAATGLSVSTANRALLLLQLSGRVREQAAGHYVPT